MPVLTIDLDPSGRPLVALYVSIGKTIAEFLMEGRIPLPPSRRVSALVDTGTSQSIVDRSVLISLGLIPIGETTLNTASTGETPIRAEVYVVNLSFAGDAAGPLIEDLEVIGSDSLDALRISMLLGRDILDRCLTVYNGPDRRVSLAYDRPG